MRDQFLIDFADISRIASCGTISANVSCRVQDVALRIGVAYIRFVSLSSDLFRDIPAEARQAADLRHRGLRRALSRF
jgi:hypothetical protein